MENLCKLEVSLSWFRVLLMCFIYTVYTLKKERKVQVRSWLDPAIKFRRMKKQLYITVIFLMERIEPPRRNQKGPIIVFTASGVKNCKIIY